MAMEKPILQTLADNRDSRMLPRPHRPYEHNGSTWARARGSKPLDILYFALEFPQWRHARSYSYPAGIGREEGGQANRVRFYTVPVPWLGSSVPSPWLGRIRDTFGKRRFDQVWFEARH